MFTVVDSRRITQSPDRSRTSQVFTFKKSRAHYYDGALPESHSRSGFDFIMKLVVYIVSKSIASKGSGIFFMGAGIK